LVKYSDEEIREMIKPGFIKGKYIDNDYSNRRELHRHICLYKKHKAITRSTCPVLIPTKKIKTGGMAMNVYNNVINMDSNVSIRLITHKNKIKKKRYVDEKSNHSFIRVDTGEDNVDPYYGVH
jgi:hypothetical protein